MMLSDYHDRIAAVFDEIIENTRDTLESGQDNFAEVEYTRGYCHAFREARRLVREVLKSMAEDDGFTEGVRDERFTD